MKKLTSLLLAAAMVFTTMVTTFAANEPTISIEVAETTVKAGEEVKADVVIANNPGMASLKVAIEVEGFTVKTEVVSGQTCIAGTNGSIFQTLTTGKYLFWSDTVDKTENGKLGTITLIADKDLAPGEYTVKATVVEAFTGNYSSVEITGKEETIKVTHDHTYGEWTVTKAPTCTETGVETRTCACGEKEERTIKATGHTFGEWTVTKAATCTEAGVETRVCACGEKEEKEIKATGHTFGDWEVTKEPTCTEAGEKTRECACGEKEVEALDKIPHTFGEWEVTKEPTCKEVGEETRTCECGEKETREIEKVDHIYGEDGICKECGDVKVETETGDVNYIVVAMAVLAMSGAALVVLRKKEELFN